MKFFTMLWKGGRLDSGDVLCLDHYMLKLMLKDINRRDIKRKSKLEKSDIELLQAYTMFTFFIRYPTRNNLAGNTGNWKTENPRKETGKRAFIIFAASGLKLGPRWCYELRTLTGFGSRAANGTRT